jgi:hypothetical protein
VAAQSGAPVDFPVDFPIAFPVAGEGVFPVANGDFPPPDEAFYESILGPGSAPAPAAATPAAPSLFPVAGPAPAGDVNNLFAAPATGRESSSPFLSGGKDFSFSPGDGVPSDGTSPPVPELPSFPDFSFVLAPAPGADNTTFPPGTFGLDFSFGAAPSPAADNILPPVTTGLDFPFGAAPSPAANDILPPAAAVFPPAAANDNPFPPETSGLDFSFGAAPFPPLAAAAAGQKRKREEEEVVGEMEVKVKEEEEGHSAYTGEQGLGLGRTWVPEIWTPEEPEAKRRRTE